VGRVSGVLRDRFAEASNARAGWKLSKLKKVVVWLERFVVVLGAIHGLRLVWRCLGSHPARWPTLAPRP